MNVPNQPNYQQNIIVVGKQKSTGTAILLTFLFGPLGLLYVSVVGGLVLTAISLLLFWTVLVPVVCWIASIIWAAVAANNANQKATSQAMNQMQQMQQMQQPFQQNTQPQFTPASTPVTSTELGNQQTEI